MRIAHLSDVHLLSLEGARATQLFNKRALGGANLLVKRGRAHLAEVFDALVDDVNARGVDHVVVTGDITNLALPSEYRFARARFARFAHGPAGVTCIPGNHDVYVGGTMALFDQAFGAHASSDPGWESAARWPVVRLRGEVAIVALSSSVPTWWLSAHGRLGRAQLSRLDEVLSDPRLGDKLRLVLIHHPPAGPHARRVLRGLRDHAALAAVLRRHGADLVLHGHEHADLESTLDGPSGPIAVRSVRSGSAAGRRPGRSAAWHEYHVVRDPGAPRPRVAARVIRAWCPERRGFATEGEIGPALSPPAADDARVA